MSAAADGAVSDAIPTTAAAEGPAVEALAITFLSDWYVEGDDTLRFEALPEGGFATVAVFIGVDLPEDELAQRLDRLRVDPA